MKWKEEWTGMPDFVVPTRDTEKRNLIDVSDVVDLAKLQTTVKPKYPIYIISKGRHDNMKTPYVLDEMDIAYKLVVEPQEFNLYANRIDKSKILVTPFSNLGQGSIPVRNWVMEHSIISGDKRHWIIDDNISGFGYQKGGRRINSKTNGDFFRKCEDFVDRYGNVSMAGIRYRFHHNYVKSPFYLNTRIYSCILLDNSIKERWRGKYNEDTDLSLRLLKNGLCTMLFTWCYCNKAASMTMKGGNTSEIYENTDNRKEFAESLQNQHPDIVNVVWRYNRWHHDVDYSSFRGNKLV